MLRNAVSALTSNTLDTHFGGMILFTKLGISWDVFLQVLVRDREVVAVDVGQAEVAKLNEPIAHWNVVARPGRPSRLHMVTHLREVGVTWGVMEKENGSYYTIKGYI